MKKMFTILPFLLIAMFSAMSSQSQSNIGVRVGPDISWFEQGDKTFTGMDLAAVGANAGLYTEIALDKRLGISVELDYMHMGAYNPLESKPGSHSMFSTYNIHLPVTISYGSGPLRIEAGGYINRMVYARNYNFSGSTFGWSVRDWDDYYNLNSAGLVGVIGYNFIPVKVKARYLYALTDERPDTYDMNRRGNRGRAIDLGLYIPVNHLQ